VPAGADEDLDTVGVEEGDRGQVENDVRRAASHAVEDWLLQRSGGLCVQPAADLDERGGIPRSDAAAGNSDLDSFRGACRPPAQHLRFGPSRRPSTREPPWVATRGGPTAGLKRSSASSIRLLFGLTRDQRW